MEGILHNSSTSDKNAEADFMAWYEDVVAERLSMLEAEESYKRRINELEQNNLELLQAFEGTQNEIKHIRTKYEPEREDSGLIYLEPYDKVLSDRERLKRDKKELQDKLREADALISELQALTNRTADSSLNGFQSGSSLASDDFELPALFQKPKFGDNNSSKQTNSKQLMNNENSNKNVLLRTYIKNKISNSNEKPFHSIAERGRIQALENENNSLKVKLKTLQNENEILKLQIDAQLKKIKKVQSASKMYVDTFKNQNKSRTSKNVETGGINNLSSSDSYRSLFISRKISHKMSSISLPVLRKKNPKMLINSETLELYSFGGFRRSQSD